ncbi:hypothetical protein [Streptomyces sp. NPDC047999]|uniref:hypothetical protein n=1 Tax=Streptomyces sp. NPDC047999 TaxID=3365497 RepID=UPI00371A615F
MTEQWGAIAAVIAAVAAIAGVLLELRTTTDQAHVEHEQWLRDQRQEAYLKYADASDTAWGEFKHLVELRLAYSEDHIDDPGVESEKAFLERLDREARQAWERVSKPYEGVLLVGPPELNEVASSSRDRLSELRALAVGDASVDMYQAVEAQAKSSRDDFLVAARSVLWTAPKRPRSLRWWRRGS